jgi:exonuclease VII large subunit
LFFASSTISPQRVRRDIATVTQTIEAKLSDTHGRLLLLRAVVDQVNPDNVLKRGYALLKGAVAVGREIQIETYKKVVTAEVKNVKDR